MGDVGKGIDLLKAAVMVENDAARAGRSSLHVQSEALRDLFWMFSAAGIDPFEVRGCGALGRRDLLHAAMKRLSLVYLEQGYLDLAIQMFRRLRADGVEVDDLLPELVEASASGDPHWRIREYQSLILPELSRSTTIDPTLAAELRAAVAAGLAQAGAELHYGSWESLNTPEAEAVGWAYAESLRLDPVQPHQAALQLLAAALQSAQAQ